MKKILFYILMFLFFVFTGDELQSKVDSCKSIPNKESPKTGLIYLSCTNLSTTITLVIEKRGVISIIPPSVFLANIKGL